jgi:hypothetical protein
MSVDRLRPEVNLLAAFSLTIAGTLAIGLPLALAIIFVELGTLDAGWLDHRSVLMDRLGAPSMGRHARRS